jgi:hypothetical protein
MESSALFNRVFHRWLERRLIEGSPTLKRAFCRLAYKEERNQNAVAALRDAAWRIADWSDFPATWQRPACPSREQLDSLLSSLAEVTRGWKAASSGYQYLKSTLLAAAELGERAAIMRATGAIDYDTLEAELCYIGRRRYESARLYGAFLPHTGLLPAMAGPHHGAGRLQLAGRHGVRR